MVTGCLGKKGEGGKNTKDRILDTTQIATKCTLQPECWVVVHAQGQIPALEKKELKKKGGGGGKMVNGKVRFHQQKMVESENIIAVV